MFTVVGYLKGFIKLHSVCSQRILFKGKKCGSIKTKREACMRGLRDNQYQGNLGLLLSHIKDYVLMNYARNKDIWKTKIISI